MKFTGCNRWRIGKEAEVEDTVEVEVEGTVEAADVTPTEWWLEEEEERTKGLCCC